MTAVFADTYFYLALLSASNQAHERAVTTLTTLARPMVTTAWALAEVADALAKPHSCAGFIRLHRSLLASPLTTILPPSPERFESGVELYASRANKDWSLTDCISFVVMRQMDLSDALTGDHHFEQAGFRAMLR